MNYIPSLKTLNKKVAINNHIMSRLPGHSNNLKNDFFSQHNCQSIISVLIPWLHANGKPTDNTSIQQLTHMLGSSMSSVYNEFRKQNIKPTRQNLIGLNKSVVGNIQHILSVSQQSSPHQDSNNIVPNGNSDGNALNEMISNRGYGQGSNHAGLPPQQMGLDSQQTNIDSPNLDLLLQQKLAEQLEKEQSLSFQEAMIERMFKMPMEQVQKILAESIEKKRGRENNNENTEDSDSKKR